MEHQLEFDQFFNDFTKYKTVLFEGKPSSDSISGFYSPSFLLAFDALQRRMGEVTFFITRQSCWPFFSTSLSRIFWKPSVKRSNGFGLHLSNIPKYPQSYVCHVMVSEDAWYRLLTVIHLAVLVRWHVSSVIKSRPCDRRSRIKVGDPRLR